MKITEIKAGDKFYENDLHKSIEMVALEDVKLVPVDGYPDESQYMVNVITPWGETEISVNKDFVNSAYALNLSRKPLYTQIMWISN